MPTMNIEIIKVKNESKGKYSQAEVTYRNLSNGGEVKGQKLFSFGDYAHVYTKVKGLQDGDQVSVQYEKVPDKNGKEWWTWVAVSDATRSEGATEKPASTPAKQEWVPDKEKQHRIIRQSCLAQAVANQGVGGDVGAVLDTADRFVAWVYEEESQVEEEAPKTRKKKTVEKVEVQ